jgi:hypothetical protein
MRFFNRPYREEVDSLKALLAEAQVFIKQRGVYYYTNDMRGPGADLVKRINDALEDNEYFGDR